MSTYILYAVLASNPANGETTIVAAHPDEDMVKGEIFPALVSEITAVMMNAKEPAERAEALTLIQAMKVIKLEATEVPL